jgi:uncharacterized protein YfbU (UPF0304 family)
MLCDLYEKLGVDGEIDHKFVASALHNDQPWAFEWRYQFLQDPESTTTAVVNETADILDMWKFLELGYNNLDQAGKERVKVEAEPFGESVEFAGFDANNEEHYGIARFFIDDLDRFQYFAGRELNSHSESVPAHRRMLAVFEPIRKTLVNGEMMAEQIIEVLKARRYA